MLAVGLIHGFLIVSTLFAYSRWLDTSITADICFYALILELIMALGFASYYSATDGIFFLDLGSISFGYSFFTINVLFCFDYLSSFFLGILTVALIVCFYFLSEYFEYDAGAATIINLSALFSQLALCFFCSFDLFSLIFFWEAISIVSFLLVQHWSHRITTYKAGLKVFTVSQVGDFFFLMFIFFTIGRYGTSSLVELLPLFALSCTEFILVWKFYVSFLTVLGLLLSSAVLLKAAQFIFYPWLLDAMEAPVPISAQLHSSTLVVIGFYVYYRFYPLYLLTPALNNLFLWAGILTAIGASVLGFFQTDGKRLLACSTASQLGYVIVCLGLNLYEEGLLLLAFCCCNKAFTFVWFGVLMNKKAGLSDFRFIGGANYLNWIEHAGLFVALANFTVFPGAFAWHVKGLFLLGQLPSYSWGSWFGIELLQLTWFFSSLYLITLYVMLFLKPNQTSTGRTGSPSSQPINLYQLKLTWSPRKNMSLSFYLVLILCLTCLVCPQLTGFANFIEIGWVSANSAPFLSYY